MPTVKNRISKTIALLAFITMGPSLSAEPSSPDREQLTLEQKIGQMIITGFRAHDLPSLIDEGSIQIIGDLNLGGVILFDRNIRTKTNARRLISTLKRIDTTAPLLIAIDQEGGLIERLRVKYGFVEVLHPARVAKLGKTAVACSARIIGRQLEDLGVNFNLAPNADLASDHDKLERAYSDDPLAVASYAGLFINEIHKSNVLTSLKHYPGLSLKETNGDTHLNAVKIKRPSGTSHIQAEFPFKRLSKVTDSIMISHLIVNNGLPASLSPSTIQRLRAHVGFKGLVITDDLDMKGIPSHIS